MQICGGNIVYRYRYSYDWPTPYLSIFHSTVSGFFYVSYFVTTIVHQYLYREPVGKLGIPKSSEEHKAWKSLTKKAT